ncbi:sensor histidine kinase [Tissierella sp.]|uniref:sensor histidine kinase n=1 Tax=Tissierella sp. TaxID=41274 RepID=UPI002861D871|nr:sensor histidine kinase [Tissierella sp.]MDR7857310.1 sensor histidine kinase [Tissierella sp.]
MEKLNSILESTIESIKGSKDEILEIVVTSRDECNKIEEEIKLLQSKINDILLETEILEDNDRKYRNVLSNKSKNFNIFNESEIREAYDIANENRIKLLLKREEEKNSIEKRSELERRLKSSYVVFTKAENISKQISVAAEYLMGNAGNIADTVDELSKRQYLGIKIIEAQEEERHRVARDMHDGPAQGLANIIVKAELCERLMDMDSVRAKNELHSLKDIIRGTLKDVRKIIYDLRPMSLDDLGLVPTLERFISIFEEDTGIKVSLKKLGVFNSLESAIQIAIFRIAQESLNNIRKHSKAKSASIILEKSVSRLNLSIIDDGIGFDISSSKEKYNSISSGYGLISIKERVELLNGNLHISSSANLGTKLSIFIPLGEEEQS